MNTPKIFRIAGLQQVAVFAVTFGTSIAIARMLSPQEIGAFSVAMAAIVVADVMKAAGIGNYLLKEQELTKSKIEAAYGLSLAFSWSLAAVVFLLRWPIAEFYKSPQMADILLAAAAGYLFVPLQSVAMGLLVRELRFGAIAGISVLAAVTNASIAIGMVYLGFGAISLALGAVANTALTGVLAVAARPRQMVRWPSFRGWRDIWSTSFWVLGSGVLNQAGYRSSELVLGRFLSIADAALYDRAMTLPRLLWVNLSQPISAVLAPVFAHEMRGGVEAGKSTVHRMRLFGSIFSPIMAGLGSQAGPVILILYGPQWAPSVTPALWLCLCSAIIGLLAVVSTALLALGRVKELFLLNLLEQSANLAIILSFAATDIRTLSMAMIGGAVVYCLCALGIGIKVGLFGLGQALRALVAPAGLTLLVFAVGWTADVVLSSLDIPLVPRLALSMLALAVAWLGGAALVVPEVVRSLRRLAFL